MYEIDELWTPVVGRPGIHFSRLQRCPHKPVSRSPEEFDVEYRTVPSATFTANLILALSLLQISALPKLDNVRGAEINSLCRHDFYRPYKIIVSYTLQYRSWFDSRTFIYGQNPLNLRVRLLPNFYQRFL